MRDFEQTWLVSLVNLEYEIFNSTLGPRSFNIPRVYKRSSSHCVYKEMLDKF